MTSITGVVVVSGSSPTERGQAEAIASCLRRSNNPYLVTVDTEGSTIRRVSVVEDLPKVVVNFSSFGPPPIIGEIGTVNNSKPWFHKFKKNGGRW